jgi:hypothetical protein
MTKREKVRIVRRFVQGTPPVFLGESGMVIELLREALQPNDWWPPKKGKKK